MFRFYTNPLLLLIALYLSGCAGITHSSPAKDFRNHSPGYTPLSFISIPDKKAPGYICWDTFERVSKKEKWSYSKKQAYLFGMMWHFADHNGNAYADAQYKRLVVMFEGLNSVIKNNTGSNLFHTLAFECTTNFPYRTSGYSIQSFLTGAKDGHPGCYSLQDLTQSAKKEKWSKETTMHYIKDLQAYYKGFLKGPHKDYSAYALADLGEVLIYMEKH